MNNKENFIGYDPIDGHKIIVLGELKDKIKPKVEIKRGNEKELIEDIGHQITELGYSSHFFNKGNHIAFCNQKNDKDLYVIEWHYDGDYKQQNIVKKVCTELGITKKELDEKSNRIKVAEKLIELSSVHKDDIKKFREVVSEHLEDIKAEKDVRTIMVGEEIPGANIIKKTCKELGLTYAQLADEIGYGESAISNASRGEVSKPMQKAIELYLQTLEQKKELEKLETLKSTLKSIIN